MTNENRSISPPKMGVSLVGVLFLATFVFMGLGSILSTPVSLLVAAFLGAAIAKWATSSGIIYRDKSKKKHS